MCTDYKRLNSNARNHNGSTNHNMPPLIPGHGTTHKTTHNVVCMLSMHILASATTSGAHKGTAFAVSQVARLKCNKSLLFQALDSLLDACIQGNQLHSQASYLILLYLVGWDKWLVISTLVWHRNVGIHFVYDLDKLRVVSNSFNHAVSSIC